MKCKSIVTLLLAMLLLILPVMPVSAAGDPAITVDMPDTIEPGKQFMMSVNVENNPGWSAFQFEITFDTAQIQLLDVEEGEAMDDPLTIFSFNEHTKGQVTAIGLYNDKAATVEESGNMEKNGALMKMYFKVLDTVTLNTEASVKVNMTTFCNAKLESQMDPTVIKAVSRIGTLTVEDNKTQPSKAEQAVVSGMVGTYPSWTVSQTNTAGQVVTNDQGQAVTNAEGQTMTHAQDQAATNAEGQVTNANGDVVSGDHGVDTVYEFPWTIALIVAGVVVAAVAVVVLLVISKKKRYYR